MTKGLLIVVLVAGAASPALAQDAWGGRGRVGVSAGIQSGAGELTESTSVVDYLEPTPITADLPGASTPFFDLQAAVRVAGPLGIGVGVSNLRANGDAQVTAAIPHPFYFERPREIEGIAGVERTETAVHMGLAYLVGISDRADVMVLAGATYFRVRQDLVTDVVYTESFPFDTAAFSSAQIAEETASKIGYHAGVDVTWKFTPRLGIGGMVRFARARIPFELNDAEVATVDVGGFQAGAGLRLVF